MEQIGGQGKEEEKTGTGKRASKTRHGGTGGERRAAPTGHPKVGVPRAARADGARGNVGCAGMPRAVPRRRCREPIPGPEQATALRERASPATISCDPTTNTDEAVAVVGRETAGDQHGRARVAASPSRAASTRTGGGRVSGAEVRGRQQRWKQKDWGGVGDGLSGCLRGPWRSRRHDQRKRSGRRGARRKET